MFRAGLADNVKFEQRPEESKGASDVDIWEKTKAGRENNKSKGSEVDMHLECLRRSG